MSKKLAAKSGLIQMPPPETTRSTPSDAEPPAVATSPRPKTAPGSMLHFMSSQSAAVKEADELRGKLKELEGSSPIQKLDPAQIAVSKWANRHEASFASADFADLKAEVASAGGNVQPIKVRRSNRGSLPYEVVFGHRRHRACLELGLPVLAVLEDVSDETLFVEMERENRQRKDLSAWEQGQMYARALDEGLYPSNRKLATAIGRDLGDVGRALTLARLPKAVVDAFTSPLDLQFRWAKPLSDAQQRDPEGLLARAKELKKRGEGLPPRETFERLIGMVQPAAQGSSVAISVGGSQVGVFQRDKQGRASISFIGDAVPADREQDLISLIEGFLSKP